MGHACLAVGTYWAAGGRGEMSGAAPASVLALATPRPGDSGLILLTSGVPVAPPGMQSSRRLVLGEARASAPSPEYGNGHQQTPDQAPAERNQDSESLSLGKAA